MAGLPSLDALAAALVSLMLAQIAWTLGWSAVNELVDTGFDPERHQNIRTPSDPLGGIRGLHLLRTRRPSGNAPVDVHVLADPLPSVSEGPMSGLPVEQRLMRDIAEVTDVRVHIDPKDQAERSFISLDESMWRPTSPSRPADAAILIRKICVTPSSRH